ncbi:DUF1266 domain-containing protein [Streptomyces sp. NRRL S-1448]|uniref:DUF1266 domain-containing protein n=1 Tax=Streptomyces sp. NRRL S-1448 TaxID=1463883 RepID=UPI003B640762
MAWDYGRASGMARWGVGGRYTDILEAEQAVRRISSLSRMTYNSWEEFAAGYILGRRMHFDDEHSDTGTQKCSTPMGCWPPMPKAPGAPSPELDRFCSSAPRPSPAKAAESRTVSLCEANKSSLLASSSTAIRPKQRVALT